MIECYADLLSIMYAVRFPNLIVGGQSKFQILDFLSLLIKDKKENIINVPLNDLVNIVYQDSSTSVPQAKSGPNNFLLDPLIVLD